MALRRQTVARFQRSACHRRLQGIRDLQKAWPAVHGQSRQPDWHMFILYGFQLGHFVSMYGNCF
jgi:hypothetical protein